jgi:hypothetical protein
MKLAGIILIILALLLGSATSNLPLGFPIELFVAISFIDFMVGMYLLIKGEKYPEKGN